MVCQFLRLLEIWMDAARFELNENGSPDNARALCMKALRWHEKNPDMWRHVSL